MPKENNEAENQTLGEGLPPVAPAPQIEPIADLPVFEFVETEKTIAEAEAFDNALEEVANALQAIGVSEGALFKVFGVMPGGERVTRRAARQAKRAANKGSKNKKAVV